MKNNKNIVVCSNHSAPPKNAEIHWRDPLENVLISLAYDLKQPPLAELLKTYHNLTGQWLVVSPVYFHTTHNDSIIAECGSRLNIDEKMGQWYFHNVRNFLLEEGITLHYHSPSLWLAKMDNLPSINSYSPAYLHNKSIMPYLEQLSEDLSWQKRLTEIQMFLQTLHSATQPRATINGLWFWGQGQLSINKDIILCDDANMMRLSNVWPQLVVKSSFEINDVHGAQHILLTEMTEKSLQLIEKACQSFTSNWYWNNVTYAQPAMSWWQRFWRKWL